MTKPYESIGAVFAWDGNFLSQMAQQFTGSEQFPLEQIFDKIDESYLLAK